MKQTTNFSFFANRAHFRCPKSEHRRICEPKNRAKEASAASSVLSDHAEFSKNRGSPIRLKFVSD